MRRSIPRVEFGIVFDFDDVPNVAVRHNHLLSSALVFCSQQALTQICDDQIALALDNRVTFSGDAGIGTDVEGYVCYGIGGSTNLYAQVNAP